MPGSIWPKAGALSLSSAQRRWASLGPTPGARAIAALSLVRDGGGEAAGIERREDGERDLGADALHHLHQPEPVALDIGHEAVEADRILADMGLDRERRRLAGLGQALQRARRALHDIADALHVDDDVVLAVGIDQRP